MTVSNRTAGGDPGETGDYLPNGVFSTLGFFRPTHHGTEVQDPQKVDTGDSIPFFCPIRNIQMDERKLAEQ